MKQTQYNTQDQVILNHIHYHEHHHLFSEKHHAKKINHIIVNDNLAENKTIKATEVKTLKQNSFGM